MNKEQRDVILFYLLGLALYLGGLVLMFKLFEAAGL